MKAAKQKAVHFSVESDNSDDSNDSSSDGDGDSLVFNLKDISDEIKAY
jgi:hypothetical protein